MNQADFSKVIKPAFPCDYTESMLLGALRRMQNEVSQFIKWALVVTDRPVLSQDQVAQKIEAEKIGVRLDFACISTLPDDHWILVTDHGLFHSEGA